jgi:hypothetical protein
VKALHGDVQDVLYVTAMMTAPAELRVASGGGAKATYASMYGAIEIGKLTAGRIAPHCLW